MPYTFEIPSPETLLQFAWLAMGITLGRGFKGFDQDFQQSDWFKKLNCCHQKAVKTTLDVTHHWWMGILMVLYTPWEETIWFGWGLIIDDLPDVPARFGIDFLKNKLYGNEEPVTP